MKHLSKLGLLCALVVAAVITIKVPVKAQTDPVQVQMLQKQMELQAAENAKILQYIQLQQLRAMAEGRQVSDIEMVKRQAMQGIMTGNNQLLDMGNTVLPYGYVDPLGSGNVAIMDKQAYDGYVSGMAYLEEIKQKTWMQYTFVY